MRPTTLWRTAQGWHERAFAPREIFFRSGDRFHHLRVSPGAQQLFWMLVLAVVGWGTYASGSMLVHHLVITAKEREIERQHLAYLDLLAEVSEYHSQFARITEDLEANQTYLLSLLAQEPGRRGDIDGIRRQLKQSETEHARVVLAQDGLRAKVERFARDVLRREPLGAGERTPSSRLAQIKALVEQSKADIDQVAQARERLIARLGELEHELATVTEAKRSLEDRVAGLNQNLSSAEQAGKQLAEEKARLATRLAKLQQEVDQSAGRYAKLEGHVATLQGALAQEIDRNAQMVSQHDFLQRRIGGLEQRLVDLRDAGQSVLERLSERTKLSMETIEKTIEMTGIDVERLLADYEQANMGQGGPFVPAGTEAGEFEPSLQLEASVSVLDQQLNRWTALREVVRVLPLSAPLDEYRISSSFGERKDPVNGRMAKHQGLDFAAPLRSSVYATAPGKVIFAGWRGRYGRVVEIDHGHGIRTRYAHLHKVLVKPGQIVAHREKIALLGSSGRSTGPHVHYEVLFKGRSYNPMQFLMAGEHVFKS